MSKMDRTKLPSTPCSNLLPLAPGSCDLSQAEKKLFCKAEQIQKMTTIFTQNGNLFQTRLL
jgi:hypothetical protein